MNCNNRATRFCLRVTDCSTGLPLFGAEFVVTTRCSTETVTTDIYGFACVRVLPNTAFQITQISAPEGYIPSEIEYNLFSDNCGCVRFRNGRPLRELEICNTPIIPGFHTVTYFANGGAGGTIDINLAAGSSYTIKTPEQANVVRPGYTFIGWNIEPGGGGKCYYPGQSIVITDDLALFAVWEQDELLCADYSSNGGIGGITEKELVEGQTYVINTSLEAGVSRLGYTFVSWNTMPNGAGTTYLPGEVITLTESLCLYAIWEEEEAVG